jgi:hypothetical protein
LLFSRPISYLWYEGLSFGHWWQVFLLWWPLEDTVGMLKWPLIMYCLWPVTEPSHACLIRHSIQRPCWEYFLQVPIFFVHCTGLHCKPPKMKMNEFDRPWTSWTTLVYLWSVMVFLLWVIIYHAWILS